MEVQQFSPPVPDIEENYDEENLAQAPPRRASQPRVQPQPEETEEPPPANVCASRALSVQMAISSLCLVTIVVVASTPTASLSTLIDESLDDTRSSYDSSIEVLEATSADSLNKVATFLLSYSAGAVEKAIFLYFQQGFTATVEIQTMLDEEVPFVRKDGEAFFDAVSGRMWSLFRSMQRLSTLTKVMNPIIAIGLYHGGNSHMGFAMVMSRHPHQPIAFETVTNHTTFGPSQPINGRLTTDVTQHATFFQPIETIDSVMIPRLGLIEYGEMKFSQINIVSNTLQYPISMRLRDLANTSGPDSQVECSSYVSLANIQTFLKELGNFSSDSGIANPIVFTVIKSSWAVDRANAMGYDGSKYDQAGYLTGSSVGEVQGEIEICDGGDCHMSATPLRAVNATDPTVRYLANVLHGKYEEYAANGITEVEAVIGNTTQLLYVGVYNIRRLDWGIDWWMILTLEQATVFRNVTETMRRTRAEINEESIRVQDSVDNKKMQTIMITVGVAALILGASIFLATVILAPIKQLQQHMSRVARMDLSHTSVSPSRFYEVSKMQKDFVLMVECLKEYRAYVPSALLNESSRGSGHALAVRMEPPTGNVAIVFTDIQASTLLWKRSPDDMTIALDSHNELIRASCETHRGYEVKTIGDSFMVSFQATLNAARLALDVHTAFANHTWPEKLDLPDAGMVLRIGLNYGTTISESNPVTGRVDYRGSTVNMASRLEGKALPGTTCVSSDVYAVLKGYVAELGGPYFQEHGVHDLKGLGNGHQLFLMVPSNMRHRLVLSSSDCQDTAAQRRGTDLSADDERSLKSSNESNLQQQMGRRGGQSAKGIAQLAPRTGLQVVRSVMTIAVCRQVCYTKKLKKYLPFSQTFQRDLHNYSNTTELQYSNNFSKKKKLGQQSSDRCVATPPLRAHRS